MQIKNMSFSAHADARGIMSMIQTTKPRSVVLVHGEAAKMAVLKRRIIEELRTPCFDPPNGTIIHLPFSLDLPITEVLASSDADAAIDATERSAKACSAACMVETSRRALEMKAHQAFERYKDDASMLASVLTDLERQRRSGKVSLKNSALHVNRQNMQITVRKMDNEDLAEMQHCEMYLEGIYSSSLWFDCFSSFLEDSNDAAMPLVDQGSSCHCSCSMSDTQEDYLLENRGDAVEMKRRWKHGLSIRVVGKDAVCIRFPLREISTVIETLEQNLGF